jgi:hypothetical protein
MKVVVTWKARADTCKARVPMAKLEKPSAAQKHTRGQVPFPTAGLDRQPDDAHRRLSKMGHILIVIPGTRSPARNVDARLLERVEDYVEANCWSPTEHDG